MYLKTICRALTVAWSKRTIIQAGRGLFSRTGKWPEKFSKEIRSQLECFWKHSAGEHRGKVSSNAEKYYCLSMFPYPSGKLHMGHVRVYTISDAMARFHRLLGQTVIHPMGWDAFGLPAENAAIERGEKPDVWTANNIANMKKQLVELGCSFDWDRELSTCHPSYYQWTQYLFLRLFEAGLVYQKRAPVNWDPVDQTVLADEQIDESGRSWRSGAIVEKRMLKQWYIRTTAYSKQLLDGLQDVNTDLWRDIISLQANWIGKCNGVRYEFQLQKPSDGTTLSMPLSVFTKVPAAAYGVSHITLAESHFLNDAEYRLQDNSEQLGDEIQLNIVAIHPFTKKQIPVFVSLTKDFGEHLDSSLGIPSINADDKAFAIRHNLWYEEITDSNGYLINSESLDGMTLDDAFDKVADIAKQLKCGFVTSEKARDWLISRQRYWGTPIPVVHCQKYGAVPVRYEDLPVILPQIAEFRGHGRSPLSSAKDWLKVKCARCDCDGFGVRETDTMDTFVDSSWYFIRYLDSKNTEQLISPEASHLMPVDLYIGGKEHAIMHLYYARFINHFLHSVGIVPCREPFVNLLTQGMVMGQSYRLKSTGKYLRHSDVDFSGKQPVQLGTGEAVVVDWEKMSKSKFNGVDPEQVLQEYGTDTSRLCILVNVAPKSDRQWSPDIAVGVLRWQSRVWSLVTEFISQRSSDKTSTGSSVSGELLQQIDNEIFTMRNFTLKEVSFHMRTTFLLNTAISRLQSLTNALKKVPASAVGRSSQFERSLAELLIMISPFAPMFASELWAGMASAKNKTTDFRWSDTVLDQQWPVLDQDYSLSMTVSVNGRDVYEVPLPVPHHQTQTLTDNDVLVLARQHKGFVEHVQGKTILKHYFTFDEQSIRASLQFITDTQKNKKS